MEKDLAHTEEYKGFKIKIHWDQDAMNPREEWDNAGKMVCWHRNYRLGDEKLSGRNGQFSTPESFQEWLKTKEGKDAIVLPLYLYDHSGITISTGPFSCPWDSGQVGYTYMLREDTLREYGENGTKRVTKAMREKAEKLLIAEVKTYDYYLTGQCYGYTIKDFNGNELGDSCWGFLGEMGYCISEAKSAVDYAVKKLNEKSAMAVL